MKRHIRLLNVICLSLVLSAPLVSLGQGDRGDGKKTRLINRSYSVTAEDKLQIDNQFGNVTVNTWDQQKITVDIEIGARGSDERAQNILDQIEVHESKESHVIGFKTKVGEIHNAGGGHHRSEDNRSFYIDYVVHMPAGNPLDLHNDFGATEVPDMKGPVNLTSKYGSLTAGNLANVGTIDVEFGKATIGDINNGKVVLQYVGPTRLGKLTGNVRIISEFSGHIQIQVGESIAQLTVTESYSGVRLVVDKNLSAQINIHTNFGEFHNETEFTIHEKHEGDESGPTFDRDYSGTAGDGKAQIKVKSEFGSLRLSTVGDNNDGEDDNDHGPRMKHNKNKDKDKDKDKDNSDVSVS